MFLEDVDNKCLKIFLQPLIESITVLIPALVHITQIRDYVVDVVDNEWARVFLVLEVTLRHFDQEIHVRCFQLWQSDANHVLMNELFQLRHWF